MNTADEYIKQHAICEHDSQFSHDMARCLIFSRINRIYSTKYGISIFLDNGKRLTITGTTLSEAGAPEGLRVDIDDVEGVK